MTDDDTWRDVCEDLLRQEERLGNRRHLYRLCPLCLRYILRTAYETHSTDVHGYETLRVERDDPHERP